MDSFESRMNPRFLAESEKGMLWEPRVIKSGREMVVLSHWFMYLHAQMTENQLNDNKTKLFSFPFLLPWNLPPFPFLTRLLLALTTSPSLILPGTLDSFLTQNCPWRSTSLKPVRLLFLEPKRISSIHSFLTADAAKIVVTSYNYILSGREYCSYLLMGTPDSVIQPLPEN